MIPFKLNGWFFLNFYTDIVIAPVIKLKKTIIWDNLDEKFNLLVSQKLVWKVFWNFVVCKLTLDVSNWF